MLVPVLVPCYKFSHAVGKDFVGFTHELTFDPSGEKTLTFSVILHDDQVPEPPEYFNVNVSTEQPRVNIGQPSLPLVQIADNDSEGHSLVGTSVPKCWHAIISTAVAAPLHCRCCGCDSRFQ